MGIFGPSALDVLKAYRKGREDARLEWALAERAACGLVESPAPPAEFRNDDRREAWRFGFDDQEKELTRIWKQINPDKPWPSTRIPLR